MTTAAALIKRLSREVLILDGGMGTFLHSRGLPQRYPSDLWSVERPEEVQRLHEAYIEAGADIIITNTFGANRLRLDAFGWGTKVFDLNRAAVGLAKAAAKGKALVAGDVGPLAHVGARSPRFSRREEVRSVFAEQVEALISAGVDLLAIETISDLGEMEAAIGAAKSVAPDLPILAMLTFTSDGTLKSGERPAAAARALEAMGVQVVGANCSFGFRALRPVCEEMAAATSLPLAIKPSAGVPPAAPPSADQVAEYARQFVEAGANVVGGCCGVSPSLLRTIAQAVKGMQPVRRLCSISSSVHK